MKDNNENTQHAELFCPKCGENIISMSVHYCATPPAERPTPDTDAWRKQDMHTLERAFQFMERLERERDEWKERWADLARSAPKDIGNLERQLAEARRELADWKDAAASAENPHPDEIHCACVPMLRGALAEARKQLEWKQRRVEILHGVGERLTEQRDRLAEALRKASSDFVMFRNIARENGIVGTLGLESLELAAAALASLKGETDEPR